MTILEILELLRPYLPAEIAVEARLRALHNPLAEDVDIGRFEIHKIDDSKHLLATITRRMPIVDDKIHRDYLAQEKLLLSRSIKQGTTDQLWKGRLVMARAYKLFTVDGATGTVLRSRVKRNR